MTAADAIAAKALSQQHHQIELADVFRLYGQSYCHSRPLPFLHIKVMRAIENCRTAALGGHVAIAVLNESAITPAAIGIVPNARQWPKPIGLKIVKQNFCQWGISIMCSPFHTS